MALVLIDLSSHGLEIRLGYNYKYEGNQLMFIVGANGEAWRYSCCYREENRAEKVVIMTCAITNIVRGIGNGSSG